MEELKAFLNSPCPSNAQVTKLRGPLTGGHRITKNDGINDLNRREEHRHSVVVSGTDYAREVKVKETEIYLKGHRRMVTSVAWVEDIGSNINFFSCGFDRRILGWSIQPSKDN